MGWDCAGELDPAHPSQMLLSRSSVTFRHQLNCCHGLHSVCVIVLRGNDDPSKINVHPSGGGRPVQTLPAPVLRAHPAANRSAGTPRIMGALENPVAIEPKQDSHSAFV